MHDEAGMKPLASADSRLELAPPLQRWSVRTRPSDRAALETLFGLALPTEPLRSFHSETGSALWLGPDEWLVLMPPDAPASFPVRHAAHDPASLPPCSIVDITHRNSGLHLSGAWAQTVLGAGCPLDLSDRAFPVGTCTRTLFGKAEIVLWRIPGANNPYHLECWRSFLPYLWDRLKSATAEYTAERAG